MNYQLQSNGCLPVNIPVAQATNYYSMLDNYYKNRDVEPMTNFISDLLKQSCKELNIHMRNVEHQDMEKTAADRMMQRMMASKANNNGKTRGIEF